MHSSRRSLVTYAACFAGLLAVPLLSMPFVDPSVPGAKEKADFPAFSVRGFLDGSFQAGVERAYDRRYGFRRQIVRTANQVDFSVFREIPWKSGHRIVLGREHTLYQSEYLEALMGRDSVPPGRLEQFARDLRRLQDALEARGKAFLFLITPSKASIDPEFLPELPGPLWPRNYEALLPLLSTHGVRTLDGHAIAVAMKTRKGGTLFPRGGTHWGQELALETVRQLLARLEERTGRTYPRLRADGAGPPARAKGPEADLAQLANLWTPWLLTRPAAPLKIVRELPEGGVVPKLYFVGTSFLDLPMKILEAQQSMAPESLRNWYGIRRFADPERELAGWDAVILETNEAGIPWLGFGFIEAVLGGTPPPRPQ